MARLPVDQPYTISTAFGVPDSAALFKLHSGKDFAVGTGTAVKAPISGNIRYSQLHPVRGNMIGIFDGSATHRLMHNSKLLVSVGQQVAEGQTVSLSGSTGLSTGPHVHWDIIKGDKMEASSFGDFINPDDWLNNQGGDQMINDKDNEFARVRDLFWRVRGREMSREEFRKYIVGKSWLNMIEILSDNEEAAAAQHAQDVGQTAIRDNWANQIYTGLARIKELEAQLASEGTNPNDATDAAKFRQIKTALQ